MKRFENKWSIGILIAVLPILMATSGCPNAFMESADKTSDEAYLFSAEVHANALDWTGAITDIQKMTTAGQAKRETKQALASYYAGRCGLRLMTLADAISTSLGSSQLWPVLLSSMKGASASQVADCKTAESTLLSIDTVATNRNARENVLLAFIEFAKMGSVLAASNADANQDGTVDGGFDGCSAASIADADAQEMGSGLTNALSSLTASGSTIASSLTGVCATLDSFSAGFCSKTQASDFTGTTLLALRALLKSNEVGFNTCNGPLGQDQAGTANDCICPVTP